MNSKINEEISVESWQLSNCYQFEELIIISTSVLKLNSNKSPFSRLLQSLMRFLFLIIILIISLKESLKLT